MSTADMQKDPQKDNPQRDADIQKDNPQKDNPRSARRSSAIDRELQAARDRAGAEEDRQVALSEKIAEQREAHRLEWNETDAALVSAQHKYAEHVARMRTPDALEELGSTVGDPTRGPAS